MGIGAVVLAAGGSLRFGAPKQLQNFQGENLVRRAACSALQAELEPVIIVLGSHASEVETFLSGINVITVVNDHWASGQASSIAEGIRIASGLSCDAVMIMLADQPLIDAHSLQRLLTRFDENHRVIASRYDGVLGAPAIFGAEHFADLVRLEGDHGAGRWLRSNEHIVTAVDMPEATADIDTPYDMKQLPR